MSSSRVAMFILACLGTSAFAEAQVSANKADVVFAFDTTGSMVGEISALQSSLTGTIIPGIRASVPDVAFGLVDFRDFGEPGGQWVLRLMRRVTTAYTTTGVGGIQGAVNILAAGGGGDIPEAGWEAMYSIAGGPPITVMEYNSTFNLGSNPPPAGESHGTLGGVGFRSGALPIVVAITDAEWHDAPGSGGLNEYGPSFAGVPSRATAIARLNAIGAKVISIVSSPAPAGDPRTQGRLLAEATGATVLPAAWGPEGERPVGCSATQCCTSFSGTGEAPSSPDGRCPLVYRIRDTGVGLSFALVDAVKVLVGEVSTATMLNSSANPSVPGQTVTFTAMVLTPGSGTPAGIVTFRDGAAALGTGSVSSGNATFATSALGLGSHSITATYEGDGTLNGSTSAALTQNVQAFLPPAGVVATATSPNAVAVSWLPAVGAVSYEIARSLNGEFAVVGSSNTPSFEDPTASPNTAYLYVVRAVSQAGGRSGYSAADLTTTVLFTDDPLVAQTSVIRAAHLTQLRTAVEAVGILAKRPQSTLTDPVIDNTVLMKASHISELRAALDEARAALLLSPLAYTDPTLTAGSTTIKAIHLQQLRVGTR